MQKKIIIYNLGLLYLSTFIVFSDTFTLPYSSSQKWVNLNNISPGTHTFKVTNVPYTYETRWRKDLSNGPSPVLDKDNNLIAFVNYTAEYKATISSTDKAVVADFFQDSGNENYAHNHGWNLSFDTSGPFAPSNLSITSSDDTGYSSSDRITSERRPKFTWNTPTDRGGNTIVQYQSVIQTSSGSSVASGFPTGTNFTPSSNLSDGNYKIRVQAKDSAGNWGDWSGWVLFTIDTSAPGQPSPFLDSSSDTGYSNSDRVTNDSTPTIRWSSVSGAYRYFYDVGDSSPDLGNTTSTSWTAPSQSSGNKTFYVVAEDAAGNKGPVGNVSVTIDTSPPSSPSLSLSSESDTGESSSDRITKDNTPKVIWSAISGAYRYVCDVDDPTPDASYTFGTFWTTGLLSNGSRTIYIRSEDEAGNQSSSASLSVKIDTAGPQAPNWVKMRASSDSGQSDSDAITNIRQPTFDWEAVNDSSGISKYHVLIQTGSGSTLFETFPIGTSELPGGNLNDGIYNILVQAEDKAGNWGVWSSARNFTVDTIGPLPPTFLTPSEAELLNDTSPTLQWQGVPETWKYQVIVREDQSPYTDEVESPEITNTSWTVSRDLALKPWGWQVRSWDVAGNSGRYGKNGIEGNWGHFTIDQADLAIEDITILPQSPTNIFINQTTVSIKVRFKNRGNVPTESNKNFALTFYLQGNEIFSRNYVNFNAGDETNQLVFEGKITTPSQQSTDVIVSASIDFNQSVADKDRSNNHKNTKFHVLTPETEPPPIPDLLSPVNNYTIGESNPLLDWSSVSDPNGVKYDLQVARDSEFIQLVINESDLNGSQFKVQSNLSPDKYFWRVRSKDYLSPPNVSEWSDVSVFLIDNQESLNPEIVFFSVHKGEVAPGSNLDTVVRIRNNGSQETSYWIGLSFKSPNAGEWPDGWLDVPPIETPKIISGGFYEHVFQVKVPLYIQNGQYKAVSAVWAGYDPSIDQMITPMYDYNEIDSFTINVNLLPEDPYSVRRLDPDPENGFDGIKYESRIQLHDLESRVNGSHPLRISNKKGRTLTSNDRNLIILAHGWTDGFCEYGSPNTPRSQDSESHLNGLYQRIAANADVNENWSIIRYDWSHDARTSIPVSGFSTGQIPFTANQESTPALCSIEIPQAQNGSSIDFVETQRLLLNPLSILGYIWETQSTIESYATIAAERGYQHGLVLGSILEQEIGENNLERVHLIGHSAGCWLTYAAAKYLRANIPHLEIQLTYLDPYIPDEGLLYVWPKTHPFMTSSTLENSVSYTSVYAPEAFRADAYYTSNDETEVTSLFWFINNSTTVTWDWSPSPPERSYVAHVGSGAPPEWYGTNEYGGHAGPIKLYTQSVGGYFNIDGIPIGWSRSIEANTVLNESPTSILLSNATVEENQLTSTFVGSFSTSNSDTGDTFIYSLVSGVGSDNNGSFTIQGNSLYAVVTFDFETNTSYSIRVRTTDQGGLSHEETFTITVDNVNEKPADLSLSGNSVAENLASGAIVGSFSTSDPDINDTFSYSLVTGSGSIDNDSFSIQGNNLLSGTSFDYETKRSYSVRVRTTDQGSLFHEDVFTITITRQNGNRTPTDISLTSKTIKENHPIGTIVGSFSTSDPDIGDTFSYTLVSGSGSPDNDSFSIQGSSLYTAAPFDYESRDNYSIRVRTTDQSGLFREKIFSITIQDLNEPPFRPVNRVPAHGEEIANLTPELELSNFADPEGDAHRDTEVEVFHGVGELSNPVWTADASAVESVQVQAGILEDGREYQWRGRYEDDYGNWSEWSEPTRFKVQLSQSNGILARYKFNGDLTGEPSSVSALTGTNHGFGKDRFDLEDHAVLFVGNAHLEGPGEDVLFDSANPNAFSVSLWMHMDGDNNHGIVSTYDSSSSDQVFPLHISATSSGLVATVRSGAAESRATFSTDRSDYVGAWHHLGYVFDKVNQEIRVYLDGLLKDTQTIDGTKDYTDNGKLRIGTNRYLGNLTSRFQGRLDDLRIYNGTLSSEEIYKLAQENHQTCPRLKINSVNAQYAESEGYEPEKAIDGDERTFYHSGPTRDWNRDKNQWLEADLGVISEICRIRLLWTQTTAPDRKALSIEGSKEGASWNEIVPHTNFNADGQWLEFDVNGSYRYVRVYYRGSDAGGHAMSISELEIHGNQVEAGTVQIIQSPQDLTVDEGGTATFTVQANSDVDLNYAWLKDGGPLTDDARITGSSSSTLTIVSTETSDAGNYSVRIWTEYDEETSAAAMLSVNPSIVWESYIPTESMVNGTILTGQPTTVTISIHFPDTGHRISDWGHAQLLANNRIEVDAKPEKASSGDWTTVTVPVTHDYELGDLLPGEYVFAFKAWGTEIKPIPFTIEGPMDFTRFIDDETGFLAETTGYGLRIIDFDGLTQGEEIKDQYIDQNLRISGNRAAITAETDIVGSAPTSAPNAARIGKDDPNPNVVELKFPDPVVGFSLNLLDQDHPFKLEVYKLNGDLLDSFEITTPNTANRFLGLFRDQGDIHRVLLIPGLEPTMTEADGLGFDDLRIVLDNKVRISMPSLSGSQGSEILFPVTVRNFEKISTLQFSLQWDASLVKFLNLQTFGLPGLTAGSFNMGSADEGSLAVSWEDPSALHQSLSDEAVLFEIKFQVIGEAGAKSDITFENTPTPIEIVDKDLNRLNPNLENGEISVRNKVQLAGKVRYFANNIELSGVEMALTMDEERVAHTGEDGLFSFEVSPGGRYRILPLKATHDTPNQGVSTLDILLMRRDILGIADLDSPYRVLAGDVNRDTRMTTLDILLMRRLILGISEFYSEDQGNWKFVRSNQVFEDIRNPWGFETHRDFAPLTESRSQEDFLGIKLGDVNGNWTPPSVSTQSQTVSQKAIKLMGNLPGTFVLSLDMETLPETGQIRVDVKSSAVEFLTTVQFSLTWDPSVLRFDQSGGFNLPGLSQNNFGFSKVTNGQLGFSWDDPFAKGIQIHEGAALCSLFFERVSHHASAANVRFADEPTSREVSVGGQVIGFQGLEGGLQLESLFWQPRIQRVTVSAKDQGAAPEVIIKVMTAKNQKYLLEAKNSLNMEWSVIHEFLGNGGEVEVSDPRIDSSEMFYRVRTRE